MEGSSRNHGGSSPIASPDAPGGDMPEPGWWSWADIVRRADRLGIPNFQRGAVWDSGNRTALLESLHERSPCGSFVLWAPANDDGDVRRHGVALYRFAKDATPMWLVDGQQRTRTLLDIFQDIIAAPGGSNGLVRKADLDDLREVAASLKCSDHELDSDARLWCVVLPAMAVFAPKNTGAYFGQLSESRNVLRGSPFRQFQPRARKAPPLPLGIVPLATLLSRRGVFRDLEPREQSNTAIRRFLEGDAADFVTLDDLLPWGPQFITGHAFKQQGSDERIGWRDLDREQVRGMAERLLGLFAPEWADVFAHFDDMLTGKRFAVGWLPSHALSDAIDAYIRINRAGIRVRAEERALAMLSRARPELLDDLAAFMALRGKEGDPRMSLAHESSRQMGFAVWMTTVTRYTALALLGGSALRWLGLSALDKNSFGYRLDRVGPNETAVGKKTWARVYDTPGVLIGECAKRATCALQLIDGVLSQELYLDHRMARPSARAITPLVDLFYRVPEAELKKLADDANFRAALARLLHWTLLAPYIDQPDLENLIVQLHDVHTEKEPTPCWNGGVEAIHAAIRQAFQRYQRGLRDLWLRKQQDGGHDKSAGLPRLASKAFESEVGNARSLQHPAVGWLYAIERRGGAREFSWKAQAAAYPRIEVQDAEAPLESSEDADLHPEKQHIAPFSIARQIVGKGGTRATASPANDIGNLTWLSRRQNGFEALGDHWTAMDRDQDGDNLAARGMLTRTDGDERDALCIYERLRDRVLDKGGRETATELDLFTTFCKARRAWMVEQMRAWLEEAPSPGVTAWLGLDATARQPDRQVRQAPQSPMKSNGLSLPRN